MIPYHDENATQRPAYVTMTLVAMNVAAWLAIQGAGSDYALASSVCNFGLIPGELTLSARPGAGFPMGEGLACVGDPGRQWSNVFTSMVRHGSWMHLIGNMWFLWLFGNNVEDSMGHLRYLVYYIIGGLAGSAAHILTDTGSVVPTVGASGAISAVMGGYLLLYPKVRIQTLFILFIFVDLVLLDR